MTLFQLDNISKVYGECKLDNITFTLEQGDFLAIVGEDDAGKTPLLEIMMGLKNYESGQIDSVYHKEKKGQLLYVPDDIICYTKMRVGQLFERTMKLHGKKNKDLSIEYCELFQIKRSAPLLSLTYNQNKCVALMNALLAEPDCLLLDEPYNFLSEDAYHTFLDILKEKHQQGMTIVLTSDRFADMFGYANRYLYLKEGDLLKKEKLPQIYRPWHMVHATNGDFSCFHEMDIVLVEESASDIHFVYKPDNMIELSKTLAQSACSNFTVEALPFEDELFYSGVK